MPTVRSAGPRLYLYAIAPASEDRCLGGIGVDGGTVYAVRSGRLAALVSDVGAALRPERRQLAAHQEVLRRLMQEGAPVLPVAFGVVADGREALVRVLGRNQRALLAELGRVAGRVEMGLRVSWDVPDIFHYFVETHPELRVARDRCFGGRRDPSQEDRIEIGRLFERLLAGEREAYTERIEEIVGPSCVEIRRNRPRDEREVANLACLVEADGQGRFEAAVFEVAGLFDDHYAFDYNGPWAPHHFVDVALDL